MNEQALGLVNIDNLNVAANWAHTFDPSSILQVSFARTDVIRDTGNDFVSLPDGFISTVGWNPEFAGGFRGGDSYVPNVGVAQYFGGGERIGYTRTSDTWQYKGTYTKIIGTHTLKFGAEYNIIGHFGRTNDYSNDFSTVGTASPDSPGSTGHPIASLLLNVPNRWSRRDFSQARPWRYAVVVLRAGLLEDHFQAHNQLRAAAGQHSAAPVRQLGREHGRVREHRLQRGHLLDHRRPVHLRSQARRAVLA